MICLGYRLLGRLGPESTRRLLKFTAEKRDALRLLSMFHSPEDLDSYLQPVALGKYPLITQMELGM